MNSPAVLAYHKVGTPELGGTWCTLGQLRGHLSALRAAAWTPIDAAGFERALSATAAGTTRTVLLTFDDAFASFATHAWPELRRQGLPALLFVVTDYVGKRSTWDLPLAGRHVPHLDWPALRDLARAGVGIGSHTATHRDLRRLSDPELARELGGSRRVLEDRLGLPVRALSYPYGKSDPRVRRSAAAGGYALGFTMGMPRPRGVLDPLALPRRGVYVIDGGRAVLDKIDASRRFHAWQSFMGQAISTCASVVTWRTDAPRGDRA